MCACWALPPPAPSQLGAHSVVLSTNTQQPNSLQRLGRPLIPTRAFEPPAAHAATSRCCARRQSPRPLMVPGSRPDRVRARSPPSCRPDAHCLLAYPSCVVAAELRRCACAGAKPDVARPRAAGACHPLRRAQPRPKEPRPRPRPQLPRSRECSEREPGNRMRCRELAPVPSQLALHLLRPHPGHRPPATARERRQRVRTAGLRLRIVNRGAVEPRHTQ